MSEGVQIALVSGGFVFFGTIASYFGVRFTARQSAKAKETEAEIEQKRIDAAAYERAEKSWERITAGLEKEVARINAALERDREVHRAELAEQDERHRQQIAELREERREQLTALNDRLDEMEAQRGRDRSMIEALNAYIRQLLRLLRDNQIVPPPAPPGMHFDTD